MDAEEFESRLNNSMGLSLVVAGLGKLVEEEGYTPREAFKLLETVNYGTFQALNEMYKERWK